MKVGDEEDAAPHPRILLALLARRSSTLALSLRAELGVGKVKSGRAYRFKIERFTRRAIGSLAECSV